MRSAGLLIALWGILGSTNALLVVFGIDTGASLFFPVSMFSGPTVHWSGLPWLIGFALVALLALRWTHALRGWQVWLVGLALLVLGNLGQGGWDAGFVAPFVENETQYYYDALRVESWREWLAAFNDCQPALLQHTRSHPPFAVLLHVLFLHTARGNLSAMSLGFVVLSSLAIPLMWGVFGAWDVPPRRRAVLCLLFAFLPAFNVYGAVSLDAVILSCATLALLGLVRLLQRERLAVGAVLTLATGVILTNLLTFGGLFLFGVLLLVGLWQIWRGRSARVAIGLGLTLGLMMLVILGMELFLDYDHVRAFTTASALENPRGFRALGEPLVYVATRLENVCDIAFFLSLGALTMLLHPARLRFRWREFADARVVLVLAALTTLAGMFLSGAYRTGETARAASFVYPYLLLAFRDADEDLLRLVAAIAALQTSGMQLFGGYYW